MLEMFTRIKYLLTKFLNIKLVKFSGSGTVILLHDAPRMYSKFCNKNTFTSFA